MTYSEATKQSGLEPVEPTQFTLQGFDTQITYSTTSFIAQPQFNFTRRGETRNFVGSEIQVEDTGVGRIVTVVLENNDADQGFESLTLLLPVVQLDPESNDVPIQTLAILSRRVIFVAPGASQLQTYDTIHLFGTAQFVQFLAPL